MDGNADFQPTISQVKVWIPIETTTQLVGGFKYFSFSPRNLGRWFNLTLIYFKWLEATTKIMASQPTPLTSPPLRNEGLIKPY